jgi:hypothetical protein
MSRYLGRLTIPSGAQDSNALDLEGYEASAMTIYPPDTLPEAVTLLTSAKGVNGDFLVHRSDGTDITLAAARADTFVGISWQGVMVRAGANVAADRHFDVCIG